ncbi:MAG: hypothetical protein ABIR66_02215 [Saprospiraceae bacterium]
MRQKNKTKKQKAQEKHEDMPLLEINTIVNNDYMLSRWAGLFEAVNVIYEHSLDRKQDFAELDLKPLAIQKYVDIKSDEIHRRLTEEKQKPKQ